MKFLVEEFPWARPKDSKGPKLSVEILLANYVEASHQMNGNLFEVEISEHELGKILTQSAFDVMVYSSPNSSGYKMIAFDYPGAKFLQR